MHTHQRKRGPRAEYREKQGLRVTASPSLSEKYGALKSLKVNVGYFAPDGTTQYRQLSHDVNLDYAKTVFRLDCCNDECVQGDHELTEELAKAVANRSKSVAGELCCNGWQNKASIKKTKCSHVIRYKLKLGY
jgi:hypothetical protein